MSAQEELEIFTAAALDSQYLKKPSEEEVLDEREFWSNTIQYDEENILLATLLPLLPNSAVFSVEADSTRLEWYDKAIAKAASETNPTLCKLVHMRLNPSVDNGFHLADIQRFSTLPSVKVVTALRASGVDCLGRLSHNASSNVTQLNLWESCIDCKALHEFLRGFPKLQSFTCSHVEGFDETACDAFLIKSSLLALCKATLQNLASLAPTRRLTSFMGSLRDFETIKEVYIEWSFLISGKFACIDHVAKDT